MSNAAKSYGCMPLPEKIAEARSKSGLTQTQIAARLAVESEDAISQGDISRWETGKTTPALANLIAFSRLTGAPLDWLLDEGRQEPFELAREVATLIRDLGSAEVRRRVLVYAAPPVDVMRFEREPKDKPNHRGK